MSDPDGSGTFGLLARLVITAIAIKAFVIPEPASSIAGIGVIAAVWGIGLDVEEATEGA